MNTITDRLLSLDPSLKIHNEGNWQGLFDPNQKGFASFNDAGIECEVGEFLYGWIRILKPKKVLETGTHVGVGASYMGLALSDNKEGKLDTIEFIDVHHKRAVERMDTLGLRNQVNLFEGDVKDFKPVENYQLILLDTEPILRFAELIKFFPYLDQGGYVFIHDLHRHMQQVENKEHGFAWPYGKIPEAMLNLVKVGALRPFHFFTPRGLTGFYKVSDLDYKWI